MSKMFRAAALAFALLLPAAMAAPAHAQLAPIVADSTPTGINIATATTTRIITGVANKKTYVTFLFLYGPHTNNVTVEYGTGANCGTGTTAIGGILELSSSTPGFVVAGGQGSVLTIPAGQDLCLLTSAAVQLSGWQQSAQY